MHAMVASMSLDIFNSHTDRLKMANIAQIVNVLQAMILTKGDEIVLTPTYHVFRMYNVHQNARFVPTSQNSLSAKAPNGKVYPTFSTSASCSESGDYNISLSNPLLDKEQTVELEFDALRPSDVSGEILRSANVGDYNDFGADAERVTPKAFRDFKVKGGTITVTLPPCSIVVLKVR